MAIFHEVSSNYAILSTVAITSKAPINNATAVHCNSFSHWFVAVPSPENKTLCSNLLPAFQSAYSPNQSIYDKLVVKAQNYSPSTSVRVQYWIYVLDNLLRHNFPYHIANCSLGLCTLPISLMYIISRVKVPIFQNWLIQNISFHSTSTLPPNIGQLNKALVTMFHRDDIEKFLTLCTLGKLRSPPALKLPSSPQPRLKSNHSPHSPSNWNKPPPKL